MSRTGALWGLMWPAIVGLALTGLLAAATVASVIEDVEQTRTSRDWDRRERACVEDPSCDLARFDRMRELEDPPNFALLFAVGSGLLTIVAAVGLAAFPDWPQRLHVAKRAFRGRNA